MKIGMCQQEVFSAAERTKAIKVLVNIKANKSSYILFTNNNLNIKENDHAITNQ